MDIDLQPLGRELNTGDQAKRQTDQIWDTVKGIDTVMVGDGEHVQTRGSRKIDQLVRRQFPVGDGCVGMQVDAHIAD